MKKIANIVIIIVVMLMCTFSIYFKLDKLHNDIQNNKETILVNKGYIYDENFLPIAYSIGGTTGYDEEDIDIHGEDFKGVDGKLAAKIGYAVIASYYGIDDTEELHRLSSKAELTVSHVDGKEMYSVTVGPNKGTGAGISVLINKTDGSIHKIINFTD